MSKKLWALELGASFPKDGVKFRVWAPNISSISLKVAGESGEILMNPETNGYFTTIINDLEPGTRYSYLLNGEQLRPDPVSRSQPEGVHGASEVIDPDEFKWEDQDWRGIPLEEMIIYEIHTGTFTQEGTFEAIIPFLDYLKKDLGVTTIELMPVAQFPGDRNWGYDGAYLYAPQNSYGGPKGLKTLINASHRKGLAIILDVVYNHLGPEGNYLGNYGPYFTDRYKTPWGPAMNYDGPESDEVRRFIIDNALYWVTEYHIDGLRIDAIHGIFDFSARHILFDIREAVHGQAKSLGRHIAVIAESNLNDVRVIDSTRKGGYGLDAQWNDDFHHSLHTLLTKERSGYYRDFGGIGQLVKALGEGFVYSGQYSSFRRRRHGNSSKHLPPSKFVVFSQNHDQVGNRLRGERLSTLVSFEALKLAAGIVLLSPNIPLLFMGEEYGEEAPFQYFISHSDHELIEAVRRGRKEEFTAFHWEDELPDSQDETTFFSSRVKLDQHKNGRHKVLFGFYKNLIRLRKEDLALSHLSKTGMEIKTFSGGDVILMEREYDLDRVICIFNLNDKDIEIEPLIAKGLWQRVLDSSSSEWGGPGSPAPESIPSGGSKVCLKLNSFSFVLYKGSGETILNLQED
jgi:maltooligosyltrehalose trehalohydrolase